MDVYVKMYRYFTTGTGIEVTEFIVSGKTIDAIERTNKTTAIVPLTENTVWCEMEKLTKESV